MVPPWWKVEYVARHVFWTVAKALYLVVLVALDWPQRDPE